MNEDKQTFLDKKLRPLPRWIFMSRWLQAPLYLGLIVAQGVYVWQFWVELAHLIEMMANKTMTETALMLVVLGLIDVVMISNLLVMVIVGGLGDLCFTFGITESSRPTRVAIARQRGRAQSEISNSNYCYFIDSLAENIY